MSQNENSTQQRRVPEPMSLAAGLATVADCQELLHALRGHLKPGDEADKLAGKVIDSLAHGLALLRSAAAGLSATKAEKEDEEGDSHLVPLKRSLVTTSPCYSEATEESCGGFGGLNKGGHTGKAEKKAKIRRRSHPYARKETESKTLEDGYTWRKYGQKDIQNSLEPRSYYRCTHKNSRGCQAQRQAQKREDGSGIYQIIYFGDHTCRLPHNQQAQQKVQKLPVAGGLISFAVAPTVAASSVPPPTFSAPLKQEDATVPSSPVRVVKTSSDETKPSVPTECPSLPLLSSGAYYVWDDETEQQQDASPDQSSGASGVSEADLGYMEGLELMGILDDNTVDFSMFTYHNLFNY